MLNSILRFFGFYDTYGLKYSSAHLASVKKFIPFWTREHQAEYVDIITKRNVHNSNQYLLDSVDVERWFLNGYNTTGIGNFAYIALYAKYQADRTTADEALENLRKYLIVNPGK